VDSHGPGHSPENRKADSVAVSAASDARLHCRIKVYWGSRRRRCAPPRPDAPASGMRPGGRSSRSALGMSETIAPTLPDATDGASTPAMPPVRKLPYYRWDVVALGPEQGHEAKHEPPRDADQLSDFATTDDHECSPVKPEAARLSRM
jgi:hypothetical protein